MQEIEPQLQSQGICAFWLFGSVARGDAHDDSDVNLAFNLEPGRQFSLFALARRGDR